VDHRKSDRRAARRYEAAEPMWGTVGRTRELTLRNIGRGGVQVESPVALPLNSAHVMTLPFLNNASVTARVRHATPVPGDAGDRMYRIGLEFVAPSPDVVDQIDALVASLLANGQGEQRQP
jgi:hypothetical protein